jgi:hypothetical protein
MQAILDKEDLTLEELLDEEDLIQECKAANPRLSQLCALVKASPLRFAVRYPYLIYSGLLYRASMRDTAMCAPSLQPVPEPTSRPTRRRDSRVRAARRGCQ